MRPSRIAGAVLFLVSAAVLAQVEGVAEFKGTVRMKNGEETIPSNGKVFVAKTACRVEWETDLSALKAGRKREGKDVPGRFKMTMLQKLSEPDKTYVLNDATKTYSVVTHGGPGKKSQRKWKVERLGRDTVAGLACEKAALTSDDGDRTEVCVSREIMPSAAWLNAWNRREEQRSPLMALKDSGLEGFPIRWLFHANADGASSTLELVRFERRSLPASLFEIPAGYKESSGYDTLFTPEQKSRRDAARRNAYANMTPEQRKTAAEQIRKNLENAPPEQRKQMEEMLKELEAEE